MKGKLYRQINVWKEIDDNTVCCYQLFERLSDNKFFCKKRDYFRYPLDEKQIRALEFYAIDSLFQGGLSMKIKKFDSIKEAIEQFEKDFE
jgi:hypothetical protein